VKVQVFLGPANLAEPPATVHRRGRDY